MKKLILSVIIIFVCTDFYSQTSATKLKYDMRTFIYKTIGQDSIKSNFFRISNDTTICPIIIWIHGGAFIWGSRNDLPKEQLEFYLNAGYSVFSIDYRLAPETKLEQITQDIKDAIEWIQYNGKKLQIDSKKIFVIGHSAGGYLALMTGYILNSPPCAIISFYGYGEILSKWCNQPDSNYLKWRLIPKENAYKLIHSSSLTSALRKERFDLYLYSRQQGVWSNIISGHNPIDEPQYFDQFCPIKNITEDFPPVLLIHGDKDTDVPFEQSVLLDEALNNKDNDHKLIRMSGSDHAFDKFEGGFDNIQIKNVFNEVIKFMDKYR